MKTKIFTSIICAAFALNAFAADVDRLSVLATEYIAKQL
jgi:hypothetical protein